MHRHIFTGRAGKQPLAGSLQQYIATGCVPGHSLWSGSVSVQNCTWLEAMAGVREYVAVYYSATRLNAGLEAINSELISDLAPYHSDLAR